MRFNEARFMKREDLETIIGQLKEKVKFANYQISEWKNLIKVTKKKLKKPKEHNQRGQ